jgi:hypothetical protein
MLGVRRAGVTEAVNELRRAGLIGRERGKISVLDTAGLEGVSCECYGVVRDEYDRLLGAQSHPPTRAPSFASNIETAGV